MQNPLPVWIAVGGTPQSVVRAGTLGLPLALAIIGGEPERFAPLVELYREAARARRPRSGEAAGRHQLARLHRRHVAAGGRRRLLRAFAETMNRIGRERGWPPTTRAPVRRGRAAARRAASSAARQQVVEKILFQHELFEHDRFLIQFSVGTLPHAKIMRSIELFGTKVAPAVRKALADKDAETEPATALRQ